MPAAPTREQPELIAALKRIRFICEGNGGGFATKAGLLKALRAAGEVAKTAIIKAESGS